MKYFIGNGKMFGVPKSIGILNKLVDLKQKIRIKINIKLSLPHLILY